MIYSTYPTNGKTGHVGKRERGIIHNMPNDHGIDDREGGVVCSSLHGKMAHSKIKDVAGLET